MKYRSRISSLAKKDLKDAVKWYDERKKGLGKQLILKVRECTATIEKNPLFFQVRYKNIHTAVLRQFPYMIHYLVDEKTNAIEIIAILHTYRSPDIWNSRV